MISGTHKENPLTSNDSGGQTIFEKVSQWLTQVSGLLSAITAVAAIIAFIITTLIPHADQNSRWISLIVAALLALIRGLVYVLERRQKTQLRVTGSTERFAPTATWRGPLPFEEGQQLPGRARNVQDLFTLITSIKFRFGVLWGELGSGKTSLLRAGLVPKLRNEKFLPIYLSRPTKNPQEAILSALQKEKLGIDKPKAKISNQLLKSAVPEGKKLVIILDQFEEYFLTNRTPESRTVFVKWLSKIPADENMPVVFLIAIREDFFARLQTFAPHIPEPTSAMSTYQLENFDIHQARQVFEEAAETDDLLFEPALVQAVIHELQTDEMIRPVELQLIGTRLKRKNIIRLNQYEALGGARGILSHYIRDEIERSKNQDTARQVLHLLCPDTGETRYQTDLGLDEIMEEIGRTDLISATKAIERAEVQAILNQFVDARILIQTDEHKFKLAHDYLAPHVRTATEGTETNVESANRLLKRYEAQYREDPKVRIRRDHFVLITKYASREARNREKARELIRKSRVSYYANLMGLLSIAVLLITVFLYIFMASSNYADFESFGDDAYIVIRTGYPQLGFLPGFDSIEIQTDFIGVDWSTDSSGIREELSSEKIAGYRFKKTEDDLYYWGSEIIERLSAPSQARTLRLLGRPEEVVEILMTTISDPQINPELRSANIVALTELIQISPELASADLFQSLISVFNDPESNVSLRSTTGKSLVQLAQTQPQIVSPNIFQILIDIFSDPGITPEVRSAAVQAFGPLARIRPDTLSSDTFQSLIEVFRDPQADNNTRNYSTQSLSQLTETGSEFITPGMNINLINIFSDPEYNRDVRSAAAEGFRLLIQAKPEMITSSTFQSLMKILSQTQTDRTARLHASTALGQLAEAKPKIVSLDMFQILIDIIGNPQAEASTRSYASRALRLLIQAEPGIITPSTFQTLTNILGQIAANNSTDSYTSQALSQFAQAKPEFVTPDLFLRLMDILSDSEIDPNARYSAAQAIGQSQLRFISSDTLQSLIRIFGDPQADCYLCAFVSEAISQLAQNRPEVVNSNTFQSLMDIISNPLISTDARSAAAQTLGQLAQTQPELISPNTLEVLLEIFTDPQADSFLRSAAAQTLGQLAEIRPEFVTSDIFQSLIELFSNPQISPDARAAIAQALRQLAEIRPEIVPLNISQTLIDLLRNAEADSSARANAAELLGQLTTAKSGFSSSDTLEILIKILADATTDVNTRSYAFQVLSQLAKSNPEFLKFETLDTLINILKDPSANLEARSYTSQTIDLIAQIKPEIITADRFQVLIDISANPQMNIDARYNAAKLFARLAQSTPGEVTVEMIETLVNLLQSDLDSPGRKAAAFAIFGIFSEHAEQNNIVLKELQAMRNDPRLHWRVAAERVLEMNRIRDLARKALNNESDADLVKLRLKNLSSTTSEEHIRFVAAVILAEIDDSEFKKQDGEFDSLP
jgi:HEAT repeat protein